MVGVNQGPPFLMVTAGEPICMWEGLDTKTLVVSAVYSRTAGTSQSLGCIFQFENPVCVISPTLIQGLQDCTDHMVKCNPFPTAKT